jgi:superfamily II DNA or RNA helicase
VTIATLQTLVNLAPAALAELGARFGTLIVDERHHVPASTFRGGELAAVCATSLAAAP